MPGQIIKLCWVGSGPENETRFWSCHEQGQQIKRGLGSGGASPLAFSGHRQVTNRISKGSQNILIYNFIITTVVCQGGGISARANALAHAGVAPTLGLGQVKKNKLSTS